MAIVLAVLVPFADDDQFVVLRGITTVFVVVMLATSRPGRPRRPR